VRRQALADAGHAALLALAVGLDQQAGTGHGDSFDATRLAGQPMHAC
jgi:hypothetical protein